MIHSRRYNPRVNVPDEIKDKFRPLSTEYLQNNTPPSLVCRRCGRKCKLQLDHANITFDDLMDGFYIAYYDKLQNIPDFRTTEGKELKELFIQYHISYFAQGQWLCPQCHQMKTNEERKYYGGK